jgi:hypothetical protein
MPLLVQRILRMDRSEAQAIHGSGRQWCVRLVLELAAPADWVEERLSRVEARARHANRSTNCRRSA